MSLAVSKPVRKPSRYTPLDRLAVNLWLAKSALQTARAMLKPAAKAAELDELIAAIAAFRERVTAREVKR